MYEILKQFNKIKINLVNSGNGNKVKQEIASLLCFLVTVTPFSNSFIGTLYADFMVILEGLIFFFLFPDLT